MCPYQDNQLIADRRHDLENRLRQDDLPHGLAACHAERERPFPLVPGNRLNARTVDFTQERAMLGGDRDHATRERGKRKAKERQAEIGQEDLK